MTIDQVVGHCVQSDGGNNAIHTNAFRTTSTSRDGEVEVTYWRLEIDEHNGEVRERILPIPTAAQEAVAHAPKSGRQSKGC